MFGSPPQRSSSQYVSISPAIDLTDQFTINYAIQSPMSDDSDIYQNQKDTSSSLKKPPRSNSYHCVEHDRGSDLPENLNEISGAGFRASTPYPKPRRALYMDGPSPI